MIANLFEKGIGVHYECDFLVIECARLHNKGALQPTVDYVRHFVFIISSVKSVLYCDGVLINVQGFWTNRVDSKGNFIAADWVLDLARK